MGPHEWFALLFGSAPPGAWLTVSTKRDSAARSAPGDPLVTRWFQVSRLREAGAYAAEQAETTNVYVGMGLRRQQLGPNSRGSASDVGVITALWIELDVAGGTHEASSRRYFKDKVEALAFLQGLPLRPSVVIDSGGGVHAHWLLREPFLIEEETERELAAGLVRGWQAFVRRQTVYEIDSTFDLARILRPPGTFNRKDGRVHPTSVLWQSDARYNPDDFADWIEIGEMASPQRVPQGMALKPGAEPPAMKFLALYQNDTRFKAHWEEKPVNPKDNSASAHCLALATIAFRAGWTDQELVDLLAAFLAKASGTPHKTRPLGWYTLTIAKAKNGHVAAAERSLKIQRATEATEQDERVAALSALLGFKIVRVVRRFHKDHTGVTMDPWYVLETEDAKVYFESAEMLLSVAKFKAKIFGHLNVCIDVNFKEWPRVVTALAQSAITDDAPAEANPCEEVRGAVREYLERRTVTTDPLAAHDVNQILQLDGHLWFSASRWMEWARMKRGMDVGPRNVTRLLEIGGCRRMLIQNLKRPSGKLTKLSFWTLNDAEEERVAN